MTYSNKTRAEPAFTVERMKNMSPGKFWGLCSMSDINLHAGYLVRSGKPGLKHLLKKPTVGQHKSGTQLKRMSFLPNASPESFLQPQCPVPFHGVKSQEWDWNYTWLHHAVPSWSIFKNLEKLLKHLKTRLEQKLQKPLSTGTIALNALLQNLPRLHLCFECSEKAKCQHPVQNHSRHQMIGQVIAQLPDTDITNLAQAVDGVDIRNNVCPLLPRLIDRHASTQLKSRCDLVH